MRLNTRVGLGLGLALAYGLAALAVVLEWPLADRLGSSVGAQLYVSLIVLGWLGLPVVAGPRSWGFQQPTPVGLVLAMAIGIGACFLLGCLIETAAHHALFSRRSAPGGRTGQRPRRRR
jgi:hypothetical protein